MFSLWNPILGCFGSNCGWIRGRIIAPLVARHLSTWKNLVNSGRLELTPAHRDALARTEFLVGSAPVGSQTVERFKKLTGRLPKVRFGSTELCLQALGIPSDLSEDKVLQAFEQGWSHGYQGEDLTGYYIGCPHEPLASESRAKCGAGRS